MEMQTQFKVNRMENMINHKELHDLPIMIMKITLMEIMPIMLPMLNMPLHLITDWPVKEVETMSP
ncbi:Uncharacterized protein FKW44_011786 [Caligus rogercresseyi]|uniref:Uncharacterized protein n=1 Tax=Caligus rogercresseyi TaxID=217165 RepID=A0A7T8HJP6_CALRO|nr:Uncharacterized protein FKW44_011786 [Caligus rogercresseyi]